MKKRFFSISLRFFLEIFADLEGKIFPDPRKSIGIQDMKILKKQAKKGRYSERSIQSAPSIVLMAPSVPYVMFLKILIASCSLNSSGDQSYDYFCVRSSFEVGNPS